jgi:glutamate racemase
MFFRKKDIILNNKAIGFMDSGVGGLTVAKVAMEQLPHENIVYLADEARLPYGEKTPDQIKKYATQITDYLINKQIKILVIACNTATALALNYLKSIFNIPIIGVIKPGSIAALRATKNHHIGIIATNGTVNSKAYDKTISGLNNNVTLYSQGCPKFIPMVERQEYKTVADQMVVNQELRPMKNKNIDTLIMGCTHFPIMQHLIQHAVGNDVTLINPGYETVEQLKQLLLQQDLANSASNTASYTFYTTGNVREFQLVAKDWLKKDINASHVSINTLEEFTNDENHYNCN